MSRRRRLFIAVLAVYLAAFAFFIYRVLGDVDPRYRESAEESLVETTQLLASLVEQDIAAGHLDAKRLDAVFQSAYAREFEARIFGVTKRRVDLRVHLIAADGRVVYDSLGQSTGADFSQWRDFRLAMRGEYGSRTTPDEQRAKASVMYVSAPVRDGARIVGVVAVGKPMHSFGQFVEEARRKTLLVGLGSALAVVLFAILGSAWLVRPFGHVRDYLEFLRRKPRPSLGRMWQRAWTTAGAAYDDVRDALTGRSYVADYVQTLTHEVKSPLSAIRGAAELLQEPDMPPDERRRFLQNIMRETQRIQETVDRMMELTAIESRRVLEGAAPVALKPLLQELLATFEPRATQAGITLQLEVPQDATVEGDAFLLQRAAANLLDNAIDFAPTGSAIHVALEVQARDARIVVRDQGPGVPEYALGRAFEKFYSLPRPGGGKRSTGLGLAFVQEIASLHQGRASLVNAPEGGAIASLTLPRPAR